MPTLTELRFEIEIRPIPEPERTLFRRWRWRLWGIHKGNRLPFGAGTAMTKHGAAASAAGYLDDLFTWETAERNASARATFTQYRHPA